MRYVWLGFHILMVVLLVVALTGGFSPAPTGNTMRDNGSSIMPTVGVITLWIVGALVFRVIQRFSRY